MVGATGIEPVPLCDWPELACRQAVNEVWDVLPRTLSAAQIGRRNPELRVLFVGDTLVTPRPARTTNFVQSLKALRWPLSAAATLIGVDFPLRLIPTQPVEMFGQTKHGKR